MAFIYSHNENSVGAKELGRALKARRIKHEGSAFRGGKEKVVINWGSRDLPAEVARSKVLNNVEAINVAANKLNFFRFVRNLPAASRPRIPNFTTDRDEAVRWVVDGSTVVARRVLNGSSGEGIQFMTKEDRNSFVEAPLYVEYIKKKHEYRVHFVNGEIIDYQRKALRSGINPDRVDWRIRNLDNGFVFIRDAVKLPEDVRAQAMLTILALPLDFGAIDLIYNEKSGQAYVLEVNTAPGLQGETIESYSKAFVKHYGV